MTEAITTAQLEQYQQASGAGVVISGDTCVDELLFIFGGDSSNEGWWD